MATKLSGILLIGIGIYLFKIGLDYDDDGYYLMNVKICGVSILIAMAGFFLLGTSKSICEIFGVFC